MARCYDGDKELAAETLETAGKSYAIRLKADKANINTSPNDLAYVDVEIVDEAGNVVPNVDDQLVKYQITGNGTLAGVGNGNPRDVSSFQQAEKKVFQGRGLVVVRPTGKAGDIRIVARGEGLKDGVVRVKSKAEIVAK